MSSISDKNLLGRLALEYHSEGRPGKIEVKPTKPYHSQQDLSLAYTPGVATPCLEIKKNLDDVYKYTAKGNLVAVISNGTAVLGLGDIGPVAGKPVMEGKGLLFKVFADIDVFDIEIDERDPKKLIQIIKAISLTFGGINLEDIKAPECFEIEERLMEELDIPLMHDDQHGTAIITSAGLLNAIELAGKDIGKMRIVINGAGAAAISCTKLYLKLGARLENITMFDSKGMLHVGRTDLNPYKKQFARDGKILGLEEALDGADMFLGLSVAGVLKKEWLKKMAPNPIVFALANPVPEITYEEATSTRDDIIMATGRSDYPNQINNVLGFPFIFRGALDVRSTKINDEMKLAAARALAALAKEPTPDEVNSAYGVTNLKFGKDYIIPKPNDPRLILHVAPAVAKAAMESGVARNPILDWDQYQEELNNRMGQGNPVIRQIRTMAQRHPKRIVFAEAENYKILKAAEICLIEGYAKPILLGNKSYIEKLVQQNELELNGVEIIDPRAEEEQERREEFANLFYEKRHRKGVTYLMACERMHHRNYFGPMLVETGFADGMISGLTTSYPDTIRPALQIIGKQDRWNVVSGMYILHTIKGTLFFADTTVNLNPSTETLVEITLQVAEAVRNFKIEPRVALVSYSNFGSVKGNTPDKVQQAVSMLHNNYSDLIVDGDIQADFALNTEMMKEYFPWCKLADAPANVFIFPYLTAGNAAYKLVQQLTDQNAIGPVLLGLKKPVHVLQMGSTVNNIVNMVSLATIDAQRLSEK
ncbi:MAG TPA: NADP-dependent malic enzyme [Bacteroidales bacterium]|jgi:malate dehydrogenase (oxaloacetate-decarboxylating)(NADP+)|nr:NADP-dependent malic enzyme [Bacteroidales bacterium]MDI9573873.1 NADP-dependent malic enzyme [Bacteroidota bacterium]OQC59899.1 MAG: NADP-dependent malic enzyme [Bacteroidetes bacterium ADurb.Bin012]MBP9587967.1 NADP-dependent malic enzyme [Bacteroidales bacterium]HNQ59799.1 NADP-dependent malic enzyme [Bacteroidales bacterium]